MIIITITNKWIVIFILLPFLKIYYFDLEQIQPFIYLWQLLSVFLAFIIILYKAFNTFNIILSISMLIILASSALNGYLSVWQIFNITTFLALLIYIYYAMRDPKELVTGLYYLFSTILVLNFISMLIGGIDVNSSGAMVYLLGEKNNIVMTLIPAISSIYLYSYYHYEKLKALPLLYIIIAVLSVYMSESGTGLIIVLFMTLFILFPKIVLPSFNTYLMVYALIFYAIVILRLQELLFGNIIVNLLEKDITFTGRTYIWDVVINNISNSWFLGVGRGNTVVEDAFPTLTEEHNMILQLALDAGLLGVAFFVIILFLVGKKLKNYKSHVVTRVFSFSIFSYLIVGLMESVFYKVEFWILLVLGYGINRLVLESENKKSVEMTYLKEKNFYKRIAGKMT